MMCMCMFRQWCELNVDPGMCCDILLSLLNCRMKKQEKERGIAAAEAEDKKDKKDKTKSKSK